MKKICCIFIMWVMVISCVNSKDEIATNLYRMKQNGKYGYIDKSGKVIITPSFHQAGDFENGLALVVKDRNKFFINKNGDRVIDLKYNVAGNFFHGLAPFSVRDRMISKYGYINKKGKVIWQEK